MEASESFGQGQGVATDDPFAESEFGDFESEGRWQQDNAVPAAFEGQQPPVVDREGNAVAEQGEPQPEAPVADQEGAQEAPAPADAPEAVEDNAGPQDAAEAVVKAAQEHQEGAQEAEGHEDAPESAENGSGPQEAAEEALALPEPDLGPEAAMPRERRDKKGNVAERRYVILQCEAPGRFKQVYWHEDNEGRMSRTKGKRQTVALAKTADDALKIAFLALGSPPQGVELVAVAAAYFQLKKVRPVPPEPSKVKLQIG